MEGCIQLVADYGDNDLAFAEVTQELWAAADDPVTVQPTSVPAFNTVATGFVVEQLACNGDHPDDYIVYANTAPRDGEARPRDENEGAPLAYAELEHDVPVVGVDAGYTFSFVKDDIETFHTVDVPAKGSQFRSRDLFPEAVASILAEEETYIGAERDIEAIPEPPADAVGYVDGYGNIKTTTRASAVDAAPGGRIRIGINGESVGVRYADGIFAVPQGGLVYAPGSSGGDDPYMEIVERGGSAADHYTEAKESWDRLVGSTIRRE